MEPNLLSNQTFKEGSIYPCDRSPEVLPYKVKVKLRGPLPPTIFVCLLKHLKASLKQEQRKQEWLLLEIQSKIQVFWKKGT